MAQAPKGYLLKSRFKMRCAFWMWWHVTSYRPLALRYWQDHWYVVNYYGN